MNRRQKHRYEAAAYISVVCLSLLLVAVSRFIAWPTVANLAANVAASLLAVCVLFFLMNRFYLLSDNESSARQALLPSDRAREVLDLHERLAAAKSIDLLGYNLANFLDEYRDDLVSCVRRGGAVRILIVNPASTAGALIVENSKLQSFARNSEIAREWVFDYIGGKLVEGKLAGGARLELGELNWVPSCSMVIIDRASRTAVLKVSVNTPFYRTPRTRGRLNLVLQPFQEPHWFEFFGDQFDALWGESAPKTLVPKG
jgi:hypothetical protein